MINNKINVNPIRYQRTGELADKWRSQAVAQPGSGVTRQDRHTEPYAYANQCMVKGDSGMVGSGMDGKIARRKLGDLPGTESEGGDINGTGRSQNSHSSDEAG